MTLHQAIETARAKAANHPEWLRAVEKAASMLQSGELVVTLLAHDVLVTSPNGSYRVNGHCPCAARTAHCYHRAAKRLVEMMESDMSDKPVAAPATRAEVIADIKANWPNDVNLADELMKRFRRNRLEMLSIDFLTAIKAAIA